MSAAQPISKYADVRKFKRCFVERGEYRNYMLVTVCLNTALRICDVISLKWSDIFISDNKFRKYIELKEKKTGKYNRIYINNEIKKAVRLYMTECGIKNEYLFASRKGGHITRNHAFDIISDGGKKAGLNYNISCHSLRKTFGYHAWHRGVQPALLMKIYNHSSFEVTKRYLGIEQDDKDSVYRKLEL